MVYQPQTVTEPCANRPVPTVDAMRTHRPGRSLARWRFAAALAVVLLAGCGSSGGAAVGSATTAKAKDASQAGDIPDSQAYVPFTYAMGHIAVKVPEGWARTETAGTVAFTDRFNSVELSTKPAPTAPTVTSVTSDEVPMLKSSIAGFANPKVSMVTRPAGPVVLVTYTADSPKNPVTGTSQRLAVERYGFWKNGTETVVTVSGAIGADNVDPWKTVTSSVAFT